MRYLFFVLAFLAISETTFSQIKEPLIARLSEIKNSAEDLMIQLYQRQELEIATINETPKGGREKKRLEFFDATAAKVLSYNKLKQKVNKVIDQLKSDLTSSNKLKVIRKIEQGVTGENGWYKQALDEVEEAYTNFIKNFIDGFDAASIGDITGIITAVVDIFKAARDFRAEQIKIICAQLDGLKLSSISDLQKDGSAKKEEAKEEKKEEDK